MDNIGFRFLLYFVVPVWTLCKIDFISGLKTSIGKEDEMIGLRRELDKMTLELLMARDPLYFSYVFNSGVGNRETLVVEWMRQESQFAVGEEVISWEVVKNVGQIHLLGRKKSSIVLLTTATELSTNRSANFSEYSTGFEANVSSTSLFTRWNPETSEPEVIAVIALNTDAADIVFFRVANGKLKQITQLSHFRRIRCLKAVNVDGQIQLIVVDTGSPAVIDVFVTDSALLDFRLMQSFQVAGECMSITVCRVGGRRYLILPLPHHVAVYRLTSGHYENYSELPLSHVSQVICFTVALQTYLAIDGVDAHVLRLTEAGEFISEVMPGHVSEWLVMPVLSYRSDVLLFSRTANLTKAYVWAGTNKGFDAVTIPQCESCLEGDWLGAVSLPFQHQNCLLIPHSGGFSSLVTMGTTLHNNNPLVDKLNHTIEDMKHCQDEWEQVKSKMAMMEDTLQHVVKRNGKNVITGKWLIGVLESPKLQLSSMVLPRVEVNTSDETLRALEEKEGPVDLDTLESAVLDVTIQGERLIEAVEQREKEVWGLDGFKGKVMFKGKVYIDNLTVTYLNNKPMDDILHNTFRKDKPQQIQGIVVIKTLQADNIIFSKINDGTSEDLMFSDGPVTMRGNVTFEQPLTVRGDVVLEDGGAINGMDLSQVLCQEEEQCAVFPLENKDKEMNEIDSDNTIDKDDPRYYWAQTIAGKNLTVLEINGVDWGTLTKNVVYKDAYQNVPHTVVVRGKVSAKPAIWTDDIQKINKPQQRSADLSSSSFAKSPALAQRKVPDINDLFTASELIVSELEVTGTVSCSESEWGEEAADVVLSDTNPIIIRGDKTFNGTVSVANNTIVKGTVGGVSLSDLLTRDTEQVFIGPTTMHGNITFCNITVNGLFNGKNLSEPSGYKVVTLQELNDRNLTADRINVLKTINGIPVSDLVFTGNDGVTKVKNMKIESLGVTGNIFVNGKICGIDLDDFNTRRLSVQKEQNISGKVSIEKAKVTNDFHVEKLNNFEWSSLIGNLSNPESESTIYLPELHVDGSITTDEGVNGYNLTELASNAVWLEANNEIDAPLVFKDETEFDILECQGFCNDQSCDYWFDVDNVVYKSNSTVTFTGKKRFLNLMNVSDHLLVQEINGNKVDEILTKTTEQEIYGDWIINGNVEILEDATLLGLLNNQNITDLGNRCKLSGDTINCKGNAVFNDSVKVESFNSLGKINGIEFENFIMSVVRTNEFQEITGFKKFSGNVVKVEDLENVKEISGENWDEFLINAVNVNGVESVDHPVTFTEHLTLADLSVDYHLQADSVCGADINEWKANAVYINESISISRNVRLASASSNGTISVLVYEGLDMYQDVIRLHEPSSMPMLRAKTVTVLGDVEITGTVNTHQLAVLHENALKKSGDQTVLSNLVVMGETIVNGSLNTSASVNNMDLRDVVTLATDQILEGKYEFECFESRENVSSSEMVSGINLTSWILSGVQEGGREQVLSGAWRVQGPVELQGPVTGEGKLGDVDLQQLKDDITRDILDVYQNMKNNLTEACEEANANLTAAKKQSSKLLYLDVTQTLPVPSGPSLVVHFKSMEEDFLAVSEKSCITTVYKWNKYSGSFTSLHREMMGYSLKKFIVLRHNELTYIMTESSELQSDCQYSGKHLWIFMQDHFKYITEVNFLHGDLFQGEEDVFHVINPQGMFRYKLYFDNTEGKAFFKAASQKWNISTSTPSDWSSATQFDWLSNLYAGSNCSGTVISVSADPTMEFVAVATSEATQVPRYADDVKVYRQNGQLFDKLMASKVNQLKWLPVPAQTWLVTLQNHSSLNLYQLEGPLLGFQLKLSGTVNATNMTTVALPLDSKVNMQPFIILQSSSTIKILRAFVQGDPYMGPNISCNFDKVLIRVPRH